MRYVQRFAMMAVALVAVAVAATPALAQKRGQNATTLAGYKTIDICKVDDYTWRYSGVIAVWNEGAIDTVGFTINDFIESKTATKWIKRYDVLTNYQPGEIPAGTTQETALAFPYSVDGAPLSGSIRNNASLTILNHSSYVGKAFGPNPKATYVGEIPPPACHQDLGCTYTQGYWGDKPDVVWPDPYDRAALFFLSGQTWQGVLDASVNLSQGYYQLAHQYIAAVLNEANGASLPQGVSDTLDLAEAWLGTSTQAACTSPGSCGLQKDWAKVLDLFNNGLYPGGPPHCE